MPRVTTRQAEVLAMVHRQRTLLRPRHTLELLRRKGLVNGDRRDGFRLTHAGICWSRGRDESPTEAHRGAL